MEDGSEVVRFCACNKFRQCHENNALELSQETFDRLLLEEIVLHSFDPWLQFLDLIDRLRQILHNKSALLLRKGLFESLKLMTSPTTNVNQQSVIIPTLETIKQHLLDREILIPIRPVGAMALHKRIESSHALGALIEKIPHCSIDLERVLEWAVEGISWIFVVGLGQESGEMGEGDRGFVKPGGYVSAFE